MPNYESLGINGSLSLSRKFTMPSMDEYETFMMFTRVVKSIRHIDMQLVNIMAVNEDIEVKEDHLIETFLNRGSELLAQSGGGFRQMYMHFQVHRSESDNRVYRLYDDLDRMIKFVNEQQIEGVIKQPKGDGTGVLVSNSLNVWRTLHNIFALHMGIPEEMPWKQSISFFDFLTVCYKNGWSVDYCARMIDFET